MFHNNEFYENLFKFYMSQNIENFNPAIFPMTQIKQDIIDVCSGSIESFVETYKEFFKKGIQREQAYNLYQMWSERNHISKISKQDFSKNIRKFCEDLRLNTGTRPILYVLNGYKEIAKKEKESPKSKEKEVKNKVQEVLKQEIQKKKVQEELPDYNSDDDFDDDYFSIFF